MGNTDNTSRLSGQIEYLKEFILPERFERLQSRLEGRTRYMTICLENIFYPHNASAVIRSAEAFGLQTLHAVEDRCNFKPSRDIVRGTDQWIDIKKWDSTEELVKHLRSQNYRIVTTSPDFSDATPSSFDIQAAPFALFMGTELTGTTEWLEEQADHHINVPMYGFAESLNVSVTAAIVMQRLMERIRASDIDWQLSDTEKKEILFRWISNCVKSPEAMLERLEAE